MCSAIGNGRRALKAAKDEEVLTLSSVGGAAGVVAGVVEGSRRETAVFFNSALYAAGSFAILVAVGFVVRKISSSKVASK